MSGGIKNIIKEILNQTDIKEKDVRKKIIFDFVNRIIGHRFGDFLLKECEKPNKKLRQSAYSPNESLYLYNDNVFLDKYYAYDEIVDLWYEIWPKFSLSENYTYKKNKMKTLFQKEDRIKILNEIFLKENSEIEEYEKDPMKVIREIGNAFWDKVLMEIKGLTAGGLISYLQKNKPGLLKIADEVWEKIPLLWKDRNYTLEELQKHLKRNNYHPKEIKFMMDKLNGIDKSYKRNGQFTRKDIEWVKKMLHSPEYYKNF